MGETPNLPSPLRGEGEAGPEQSRRGGGESSSIPNECYKTIESFQARFEEAMDDDFNTAQVVGYLYDLQSKINILLEAGKNIRSDDMFRMLREGFEQVSRVGGVLGLFQEDPEKYINAQKKDGLKTLNLSEEEILKLIEARNAARKEKNWKRADEIRNELISKGVLLEDTPSGTTWKLK
jgi:cysteinyl-tRNA synthetase